MSDAWSTRRANKFYANLAVLKKIDQAGVGIDVLRFAVHEVSDQLAACLSDDVDALPRGYRIVKNGWGERGVALGDVLFSPAHSAPPPGLDSIQQFGKDLREGLLREITEQTGCGLDFSGAQIREKKWGRLNGVT